MQTFTHYPCIVEAGVAQDYLTGQYPTNQAGIPQIWGHYAKNEEFLANFGENSSTYLGGHGPTIDRWKDPSGVIMIGECKDLKEAVSAAVRSDKKQCGGPYIELGDTTWLQVFDELSYRHNNGQNSVYLDGHARFRNADWFKTQDGRHAISPAKENYNYTKDWNS